MKIILINGYNFTDNQTRINCEKKAMDWYLSQSSQFRADCRKAICAFWEGFIGWDDSAELDAIQSFSDSIIPESEKNGAHLIWDI